MQWTRILKLLADENHPEDMLDPDGYGEVDHVDEPEVMPGEAFTHAAEGYAADPNHGTDNQDGYSYDGQDHCEPHPDDYDGQDHSEPHPDDYDDGHDNQEPPDYHG